MGLSNELYLKLREYYAEVTKAGWKMFRGLHMAFLSGKPNQSIQFSSDHNQTRWWLQAASEPRPAPLLSWSLVFNHPLDTNDQAVILY